MNQEGRILIPWDTTSHAEDAKLADEIFISNESAMMTEKILASLPTYSHSNPTGVRTGKMWKRHILLGEKININEDGVPNLPTMPVQLHRGYVFCWMQPHATDLNTYDIIGKPVQIFDWKKILGL